jgi:pimeloyl-ACP methyl ester carboxylesterase
MPRLPHFTGFRDDIAAGFRSAGNMNVHEIELSAGTIEYADTGGDGPVTVMLHGLLMDATLWDQVIPGLPAGHRYLAPTLPLGAHRRAMNPDADLSLPGIARLVTEFLDRLGLQDVTLVGNDTGGALAQLLIASEAPRADRADRAGRGRAGWAGSSWSPARRSITSRPG